MSEKKSPPDLLPTPEQRRAMVKALERATRPEPQWKRAKVRSMMLKFPDGTISARVRDLIIDDLTYGPITSHERTEYIDWLVAQHPHVRGSKELRKLADNRVLGKMSDGTFRNKFAAAKKRASRA
jgi:hypothetical protein